MNKGAVILILTFFSLSAFAQEMGLMVSGLNTKSVAKENLDGAMILKDINPGYPASWINHYISVELMSTNNGIVSTAMGANDTLTAEQRDILELANVGALIEVRAKYGPKNVSMEDKPSMINFSFSIVPAIEAEYIGGTEKLMEYLSAATVDKIIDKKREQISLAEVSFTINKEGKTSNVKIVQTSHDDKVDMLLLKAVNEMPTWKPAKNSEGATISQEFKFSIGNTISC